MHRLLSGMRALLGGGDAARAWADERRAVLGASEPVEVEPAFRAEMGRLARGSGDRLTLGACARDPSVAVRLDAADIAGRGHALVLGTSGAGKTRTVGGVARQLLERIARDPGARGLAVVDHKGELVAMVRAMLRELARAPGGRHLLDRLVVVDPFSAEALVPFQILRRGPGEEPELVALEAATVINRLGGAELGVNQDAFLYHALLLGVDRGLSLPEVADLLGDLGTVGGLAARASLPAVRAFFDGERRLSDASLQGVRARLHRLCRMPSARLMLGARGSVSLYDLLRSRILLIDLGSPPFGCEDLASFWAGILTLKLTRAIFQRTEADARRPVTVLVDEWQEGLAAGGDIAQHYARVLAVARSRGVSLVLVSQSLAGAARVDPTLPEVVATNTSVQMLFRASAADARAMAHLLPVTGRRPRPPAAPWEERPRSPFLDRAAERDALLAEIPSLPQRVFYFWNRHHSPRAELVRASSVDVPDGRRADPEAEWLLRHGALARPIAELEAEARRGTGTLFRQSVGAGPPEGLPRQPPGHDLPTAPPPRRRPARRARFG